MAITQILDKTYNPKLFEKKVYDQTIENFKPNKDGSESFSILMPPPNVTGSLHLGHALTYTIQDILTRFNRQLGVNTLWQPGIDHAGIATQMVVSKELEAKGIDPKTLTKEEFIEKIWQWKEQSGGKILEQQKALGCSAPWELSRFTMDEGFSKAVTEAFVKLYKDGLIYRAKRLVNWDTKLKTAISDLEIQNKEEKGTLWHIKYQIENSDDFIVVATSRPETMFADTALAVNPEDDRYKHLIGKNVKIPLTNRVIKIIADDYADIEKGSGCVKITPAHDYNDFAVGKRHNLEMISILDQDGHMIDCEYVPDFIKGLYLKKARKLTLEKLTAEDLLQKEESIIHNVPYADRSGVIVEPLLTDQWFVDAKKLSIEALKVVEDKKVKFFPEKWQNTYFDWMKNIEPWCVSRQIIWGHQIPAWFGPKGEMFVEITEEEVFAAAEKQGIKKEDLRRETDVLDTWFSSGLWPFATLGWPNETEFLKKYYPTSTLVTGFDIIFFWVARMMMMSLYFMKEIPFKDIYIHALVRDEKGQKMSKSKGNVMDPLDLMEEYGTDALRFTLAFFSVPGRDIKLSKDNIKISRNFMTKIWNAARFLQTKDVSFNFKICDMTITKKLNHWIIAKLMKFQDEITQNIKDYRFDYISQNIQFFLRETFCDFFVEAMKFQDDEETKNVAGAVFSEFLRIANPLIPFITDYLANTLKICESFIDMKPFAFIEINENFEREVDEFKDLIHKVRSAKDDQHDIREKIGNWQGELKNLAGLLR